MINALDYEVNFLTASPISRSDKIRTIESEFDFVQMCQKMIKPFGFEAKKGLDRFIALSLRKLLCDEQSMLIQVCPNFKMPPLSGLLFDCPGENNDMKLHSINPDIRIRPQNEWLPLKKWLDEKIAWIDKDVSDIPDVYTDRFFRMIVERIGNQSFAESFYREEIEEQDNKSIIWKLKDTHDKEKIYRILKTKGYYELTIRRMIKYIADKKGAHLDASHFLWVDMANSGKNINQSAVSVFATHMIYAATKQIKELKDYLETNPMIETL